LSTPSPFSSMAEIEVSSSPTPSTSPTHIGRKGRERPRNEWPAAALIYIREHNERGREVGVGGGGDRGSSRDGGPPAAALLCRSTTSGSATKREVRGVSERGLWPCGRDEERNLERSVAERSGSRT
jgi:hypothetical protein